MRKFQPFQYIRKYVGLIVAVFVILTIALYLVLSRIQSYTAAMVINYSYDGAERGQTPAGSVLDVSEIYSSNVISQALDNLGWDSSYVDLVRGGVSVQQIEDESVTAINEALNDEGESSDLQPTEYAVYYTVGSSAGSNTARIILDEIMDVYFTEFSKRYVNGNTIVNSTSSVNNSVYDYIEQVELLDGALINAISSLSQRAEATPAFYSSNTGYSFNDLSEDFSLLREREISALYSYILRHQVTKDKEALMEKYKQRVQSYELSQENNRARLSEVEGILDAYVEKLRESNNTAQSQVSESNNMLYKDSNVIGNVEDPSQSDQTTEYEQLLQNWINVSDAYNNSVINANYCQYVIDCFSGNTDAILQYQRAVAQFTNESGTDVTVGVSGDYINADEIQAQLSSDIYTETTVPCSQEDIAHVEEQIDMLVSEMNRLYDLTALTDAEYNEYLGGRYIQILSSNHVYRSVNVGLYTVVGAALFLVIGCGGAIVLGRAGDIIDYVAYTDHQFGLPNRVACDHYIQKYSSRLLPLGFYCIFIQVTNQAEINQKLGRKGGDKVLEFFATSIKSVFKNDAGKHFAGYNGSGQFIVFGEKITQTELEDMIEHFQFVLDQQYRNQDVVVKYSAGVALSSVNGFRSIRELISEAGKKKNQYAAGAYKED